MRSGLILSLTALASLLPLATAGCRGDRIATYPATGTVRFDDGRPVPFGVVEFRQEESGITARAKLDESGKFKLGTYHMNDGAPAGNYRVIVIQHFIAPPRSSNPRVRSTPLEHAHDADADIRVAPEFGDYASSRLRAKIEPGQTNDIELVVTRLRPSRQGRDAP